MEKSSSASSHLRKRQGNEGSQDSLRSALRNPRIWLSWRVTRADELILVSCWDILLRWQLRCCPALCQTHQKSRPQRQVNRLHWPQAARDQQEWTQPLERIETRWLRDCMWDLQGNQRLEELLGQGSGKGTRVAEQIPECLYQGHCLGWKLRSCSPSLCSIWHATHP